MNGEQFLRKLRESEKKSFFKPFIPVVVISAFNDKDRINTAEDPLYGLVSGYLTKPFDKEALVYLLQRIVLNKEAEILRELFLERKIREIHSSGP